MSGYYWSLKVKGSKKYNPDQPRDPKGSPTGGQWASSGDSGIPDEDDEPELIKTTAWDLMGDHYDRWANGPYAIRVVGGRTLYSDARNTAGDNVQLSKLVKDPDAGVWGLRQINRYVKFDAPVELVKLSKEQRRGI